MVHHLEVDLLCTPHDEHNNCYLQFEDA